MRPVPAPNRRNTYIIPVVAATALGCAVRLSYTLASDFPLSDGGLFVVMTRELQAAGFRLPELTAYNGLGIPFAYPPLAFYVVGAIASVTGIDLIELFRWVPLVLSTACVPAFALVASRLLPEPAARAATFAYALLPAGFAWPLMGGGLTRAAGLLFALLALAAFARARASRGRGALIAASVLSACTLLSHPAAASFLALTALLFALHARTRDALVQLAAAGAGAFALAAPWWVTVLTRHGAAPFVAASASDTTLGASVLTLLRWNAWYEPLFPLVGSLAMGGLVLSLARRELLLPLWLAVAAFLLPQRFQMFSAVPAALLAGAAVAALGGIDLSQRARRLTAVGAVAFLAAAGAIASTYDLVGLSVEERAAMAWVARSTAPDARVLVVSDQRAEVDRTGEWLPALTGRASVAVPQGAEWLPGGVLGQRVVVHEQARACARGDAACVERLHASGVGFDLVYLPSLRTRFDAHPEPCCVGLAESLARDGRYERVHSSEGAVIFARR